MADEKVIQGIPEAIANLKRWQIIKVQAVKDRLKKQAFKVELLAKQMAPVKTGRLRASISTNWSGSDMNEGKIGAQAKSGDGIKRPDGPPELVCVVGSNVFYAPLQEHGTSRMPARPYLFPAYFTYEGETIMALATIMKEDVKLG
jgi:HK97 gp10 family phage protein